MSFDFLRLKCDPETLFPYEALEGQLQKFGYFAIAMGAMLLPNLTAERSAVPADLDEYAEQEVLEDWYHPLKNSDFLERMRGVIDDAVQFGLI